MSVEKRSPYILKLGRLLTADLERSFTNWLNQRAVAYESVEARLTPLFRQVLGELNRER
jgi:hypothetical protein